MRNIISLLLVLGSLVKLSAQLSEGTPCTALCIDPNKSVITGRMPRANGISPNLNRPCSGSTSEDNPTWWIMRPSGNWLTFTLSASSCFSGGICPPGVSLTLFEGSSCGDITTVNCIQGKDGVLTANVTPCNLYYLQLDGNCETVCDVTISYDKNQILTEVAAPEISGPQQICKGATTNYSAVMTGIQGCQPDGWSWSLTPANAGTISTISSSEEVVVKITDPPLNGKVLLCVNPVFNGKCPPKTNVGCVELTIPDDNVVTGFCTVELCPRQLPYALKLSDCLKTADIIPSIVRIDMPAGSGNNETIKYTVNNTTCSGSVDLNVTVKEKSPQYFKQLPALLLCSGETRTIRGRTFSCTDAEVSPIYFLENEGLGSPNCDTMFEMVVQCIDIATEISGQAVLDCNNNPITLDISGIGSHIYPGNRKILGYNAVGNQLVQWTKDGVDIAGATNNKLEVSSAGNYGVKVKYEYKVSQIINEKNSTQYKNCANSTFFMVKSSPAEAIAETPVALTEVCTGRSALYSVKPDPMAQSYKWTVNGAAQISGIETDPKKLMVINTGSPYQVCLSKRACGKISPQTCISVNPRSATAKPEIKGLSECQGDSSVISVGNRNSYSHAALFYWKIENGDIRNWNLDSTMIKVFWKKGSGSKKVKLIVADICGSDSTTSDVSTTLAATLQSNSPVCAGLFLQLNVEGGVYYSWEGPDGFSSEEKIVKIGSMTAAQAGIYSVTVSTSNGCSTSLSANVEVNDLPSIASSNSPVCPGNNLQLNASGGTQYRWEGPNGFTSTIQNPEVSNFRELEKGIYFVTISDANGCSAVKQVETTLSAAPIVTTGSNSPVCEGNALRLSADGGTRYRWAGPGAYSSTLQNPEISNTTKLTGGSYVVTVTNASGCTAVAQTTTVVNALPQAIASCNSPVCAGTDANLIAQGGSTYSWSGPDNFKSGIQNPVIPKVEAKNAGIYTVTVTDANNCSKTATAIMEVKNCISTKDANGSNGITVFPNPASDRLIIQSVTGIVKVELFNAAGQKVLEKNTKGNEVIMEVPEISPGEHLLKVFTDKTDYDTFKILIRR